MRTVRSSIVIAAILVAVMGTASLAGADPSQGGQGAAHGVSVDLAGEGLIPPTPEATAEAPPFPKEDAAETTLPIDADPLLVNGTLNASVALHPDADIDSSLEVEEQELAGPYNAAAVGSVEDLEVIIDAVEEDVPLVEVDLLRGEVVAKCTGSTVSYSAQSEAVNLVVGGDASLGDLANDIIDQLFPGLDPLDPIVNLEETVTTELDGGGLAVDALVITVLEAADAETPLLEVRLGHAELDGVTCGAGGQVDVPECSDTQDNDDDGVVDADDPGCHSDGDPDNPDSYDPEDDDESDDGGDGGGPQCSDGVDNDGDGVSDIDDPGCHTDDDATNPDSYDPDDDDEANATIVKGVQTLPTTGAAVPLVAAVGLGLGGLALQALRRRAV